jgi:hypothetical protein
MHPSRNFATMQHVEFASKQLHCDERNTKLIACFTRCLTQMDTVTDYISEIKAEKKPSAVKGALRE